MAFAFVAVVVVQAFRGRMTVEAAFAFASGGVLAWFGIAFKVIDIIGKTEIAEKAAATPPTIAAGGNVTVETPKDKP